MKKPLKIILIAFLLYLTVFLVVNPKQCIEAAQEAIKLCMETVIPSLFPFFVCSGLLCSLGFSSICSHFLSPVMRPLFNLPGSGALALFMGILSGYPIGAATTVDLYKTGQCTKAEAERMLSFCNNSGPMFIIGAVGSSCLGNAVAGQYLYLSHIVAALLVGILFRLYKPSRVPERILPPSFAEAKKEAFASLGSVVDSSVWSILKVCGFVIFFAVFVKVLPYNPYLYSFVEITGGIKALSQNGTEYTLPLISLFLALSGLSVLFQVSAIIQPYGLSLKPYIFGKLMQGVLSFIITFLMLKMFPFSQETFSDRAADFSLSLSPVSIGFSSIVAAGLSVFVLICIMVPLSIKKSNKKSV